MQPLMWMISHYPSNSIFVVEYTIDDGRVVRVSQGFTKGNVVDLLAYKRVKQLAQKLLR